MKPHTQPERIVFLLATLLPLGVAVFPAGCQNPSITTTETTQTFRQQVEESDQPVLVEFYTTHCPACMFFESTYNRLADEYGDRVTFLKVNGAKTPKPKARYKIRAYPTVVLLVDGQEQGRWVNEHDLSAYRQALDNAIQQAAR